MSKEKQQNGEENDYGFPEEVHEISDDESEKSYSARRYQEPGLTEKEKVQLLIQEKQTEIANRKRQQPPPKNNRNLYKKRNFGNFPPATCRDGANTGFKPFKQVAHFNNKGITTQGFSSAPGCLRSFKSPATRKPENLETGSRSKRASIMLERRIKKFKQDGKNFISKDCRSWEERAMFYRREFKLAKHKLTKRDKENAELKRRLSKYEKVEYEDEDDKSSIFEGQEDDTTVCLQTSARTAQDQALIDGFFAGKEEEGKGDSNGYQTDDSDENFRIRISRKREDSD